MFWESASHTSALSRLGLIVSLRMTRGDLMRISDAGESSFEEGGTEEKEGGVVTELVKIGFATVLTEGTRAAYWHSTGRPYIQCEVSTN